MSQKLAIQAARQAYLWPQHRPSVAEDHHGWFSKNGHIAFLRQFVGPKIQVVIELGSWLGKSTQWFFRHCPNAMVFAVDHWRGSAENHRDDETARKLPTLFETFCVNMWPDRHRVVPVKESTLEGMDALKRFGVSADLIYVDAAHDQDSVFSDVVTAWRLWPGALLCGDDWVHDPVRKGVEQARAQVHQESDRRYGIITGGRCWAWQRV